MRVGMEVRFGEDLREERKGGWRCNCSDSTIGNLKNVPFEDFLKVFERD